MPIAAYTSLTITNGTLTCNLVDGTNFTLTESGWAPQVPTRRRSTLGGRPYERVVEDIRINVFGATGSVALGNLANLILLIDQAERWARDESDTPVTIVCQPQGSTLNVPLVSLIYGFDGDRGPMDLPVHFNDELMLYEISNVRLRFIRDGAWYGGDEDITMTATEHPSVVEATFIEPALLLSPVRVAIGPMPSWDAIAGYDAGYLLIADRAERLEIIDAVDLDNGAPYSTDADAARFPEGAGVLVYTPASTSESGTFYAVINLTSRRIGIVAALRNTSATTTFQVRVFCAGPNDRAPVYTRPYHVDTSTTDPRIVFLGVALCDPGAGLIQLRIAASAASGTLVVDYLALVDLNDPSSRVLAIGPIDVTKSINLGDESELVVDPQAKTALSPLVRQVSTTDPDLQYAIPDYWRGDAFILGIGSTIAAIWCGRNAGSSYWRPYDPDVPALVGADIAFTRLLTYLAPQ